MRTICASTMTLMLVAGLALGAAAQDDPTSRPPIPSAGCGSSEVDSGQHDDTLALGDTMNLWSMYVPAAHDGSTPVPLWVQLHGVGGLGSSEIDRFDDDAERLGFVVLAPTALLGVAGWTWREEDPELDTSLQNPDTALIVALMDQLAGDLCLDLARIYIAGYSGGGEGASVLGCVLQDRVAAVAPVAAMLDVGGACEQERPMPFLALHGQADTTAFYDGGYSAGYNDFPVILAMAQTSIPERVANVAARNGCDPEPSVEPIDERQERWSWACPPGADVDLLVHTGGHGWPLGATDAIWEFFEQHPLPE